MPATLDQIVAGARKRVSEARKQAGVRELERRAAEHRVRGFRRSLERGAAAGTAVIAELKKASPSRGIIRKDFEVVALAAELEKAGASALSVLTDEEFFQGSLENLRRAVDTGCDIIGVNSRDLRTFRVDLETPQRLAKVIPGNVFAIAESGIHSGDDVRRLKGAGYRAFLVGESLMKAESPGAALAELLASSKEGNVSRASD